MHVGNCNSSSCFYVSNKRLKLFPTSSCSLTLAHGHLWGIQQLLVISLCLTETEQTLWVRRGPSGQPDQPTPAGCGTQFMRCCWTGTTGICSWGHLPPSSSLPCLRQPRWENLAMSLWLQVVLVWKRMHAWLFHLAGISWLSWNDPLRYIRETFHSRPLIYFLRGSSSASETTSMQGHIYNIRWSLHSITIHTKTIDTFVLCVCFFLFSGEKLCTNLWAKSISNRLNIY